MALVAAFAVAVITTPAGVSGAVLLLPFQVSVLGTPSPAVTPTNLLYNVVACPGAMWRYWRQGQTGGTLTWLLLAGTLPGVVAGSIIRVYVLPDPVVFAFVVAGVLIPLGTWLALAPGNHAAASVGRARLPRTVTGALAAVAGCVGGIYGIGGLAGGYAGARMHARMPETLIRRLLALVVASIGIRFLVAGLTGGT